jgi:nucleoside-diphosphate-sugar epimerase
MKITVFGASGKSGQQLVEKALDMGFQVLAYVRRENSINIQHANLKILAGNLSDANKLEEAIKGADACISTLGGSSLRKHVVEVTNGIDRIVIQMEKLSVNRIMYLSSFGVGDSQQYLSPFIRFLLVKLILRIPIADHSTNEQRIQRSNLKWTIFRPGRLSNDPLSEDLKFGCNKPTTNGSPKISRASLAVFMLNQIADDTYVRKALWVNE